MSLPLVTRFGADPLLDLEVANKRYVDNNAAGGIFLLTINQTAFVTNNVFFNSFGRTNGFTTVESAHSNEIETNFDITRVTLRSGTNTKSDDIIVGFRDDGVNAGVVTVGAGLTGVFDSGVLSDSVVAGSLCNAMIDTSDSSSGSFSVNSGLIQGSPS